MKCSVAGCGAEMTDEDRAEWYLATDNIAPTVWCPTHSKPWRVAYERGVPAGARSKKSGERLISDEENDPLSAKGKR